MKKIVINGRFLMRRVTGVERYAREILLELDKLINPGELEIAIPPETKNIPKYKNIRVIKVGKLHNRLWEHISFPIYVMKNRGISLNLCNVAPLLAPGIVCIHDVKVKSEPQYFSKKFIMWYYLLLANATKRAKAIITVSNFSKSEIIQYFNVNENKIYVIPSAWNHFEPICFDENALNKYGLESKKYYFSMSSLEPNKNFKWIAEVAKRNPSEVFAVSGSLNTTVFSNNLGIERVENVRFLGYVSDEEAKTLMRECKVFLFPTFYEGFGLPPLEAMSTGAKAIVSDTKCMHEIYENTVFYLNPYSYDINLDRILNQIINLNRQSILNKFTWGKSAIKLLNLLKKW